MNSIQNNTEQLSRLTARDLDPELYAAIEGERLRQENHIELIASDPGYSIFAQGLELTGIIDNFLTREVEQ